MRRSPPRRRSSRWRSLHGTIRRYVTSRAAILLQTAAGVVRLFGWLYVAVLVPTLLVVTYVVIRAVIAGGDVAGSLHMFPLAMIWPLAAVALRSDTALALKFPLNAVVLVGSVALVLTGWSVLIRGARSVLRRQGTR